MKTIKTFNHGLRGYRTPQAEIANLPLSMAICDTSGDLVDIDEEDAGLVWGVKDADF